MGDRLLIMNFNNANVLTSIRNLEVINKIKHELPFTFKYPLY